MSYVHVLEIYIKELKHYGKFAFRKACGFWIWNKAKHGNLLFQGIWNAFSREEVSSEVMQNEFNLLVACR